MPEPEIPSYDQWMKDTYRLLDRRSALLKNLDEAIKTRNREAIASAFEKWKRDKTTRGKKWWNSVFNEKGAITRLYRGINNDRMLLTQDEIGALKWLKEQQSMALQTQFRTTEVRWKNTTLMGLRKNADTYMQKFKANKLTVAKEAYNAFSITKTIVAYIEELCKGTAATVNPNHVFEALKLGSVQDFSSSIAPFIGSISSGGKALVKWGTLAKQTWDKVKLEENTGRTIAQGDPDAAFRAMLILVDREISSTKHAATIATTAFTAKSLGLFCDGGAVTGPVAGILETLAGLFQTIFEYVRFEEDCVKGNKLIQQGNLDFNLFSSCPILGCYYLLVQDHSTIIALSISSYGQEGWMMEAELLRKELEPVLVKARALVEASPIEVPKFTGYKGLVIEKGFMAKAWETSTVRWTETKDKLYSILYTPKKEDAVDEIEMTDFSSKGSDLLVLKEQKQRIVQALAVYNKEIQGFFTRQSLESSKAKEYLGNLCQKADTDENLTSIDNFFRFIMGRSGGQKPADYHQVPIKQTSRLYGILAKSVPNN
jgi:hypothetical protein